MYAKTVYSNRRHDERVNRHLCNVMDAIYESCGFRHARTIDTSMDLHGVDLILYRDGRMFFADEKAATAYWNKELNTFCCELTCHKTRNGFGWFAPENNQFMYTSHYVFIWLKANNSNLSHITKLRAAIVNKYSLQNYFNSLLGNRFDSTENMIASILGNRDSIRINDDVKLIRCNICPEYPVNILFSENLLKSIADAEFELNEQDISEAIRSHNRKQRVFSAA